MTGIVINLFFVSHSISVYGQPFGELDDKILRGFSEQVEKERQLCEQYEAVITKDQDNLEDFDSKYIKLCEQILDRDIDVINN